MLILFVFDNLINFSCSNLQGEHHDAQKFISENFDFEIIFCVADATDASIQIVKSLIDQYPAVKARLVIGKNKINQALKLDKRVTNPKMDNIKSAYEE